MDRHENQQHFVPHPQWGNSINLDMTTIRNIDSTPNDMPPRTGMQIVFEEHFPDPSVFLSPVGPRFCAVATNHIFDDGRLVRVQAAFSDDLENWEMQRDDALVKLPEWAVGGKLPQSEDIAFTWAPFVWVDGSDGLFKKYAAYQLPTKDTVAWFGIGVAVSDQPTKGYRPIGDKPLVYGRGNECIDPFVRKNADGSVELLYGSDGKPIQKVLLTEDGLARNDYTALPEIVLNPLPNDFYQRVLEGIYLDMYDGEDISFVSGADCYGRGIPYEYGDEMRYFGEYAIVAAKFSKETGDVERRIILEGNEDLQNIGNNCILKTPDMEPEEFILFAHAIDRNDRYLPNSRVNKRKMVKAKGKYIDGWPTIQAG